MNVGIRFFVLLLLLVAYLSSFIEAGTIIILTNNMKYTRAPPWQI